MLERVVGKLESTLFRKRGVTLWALVAFTVVMLGFAVQLRMESGFEKQMPVGHEYVETFNKYRQDLFGANRLTIAVKVKDGSIWTKEALGRLYQVTQAVMFLPNVDRLGVQSLWTPNTFVNEITEEGFRADPLINGEITPDSLTPDEISKVQAGASIGGFIGKLVSRDQKSALITAELSEYDSEGKKLDYIAYNKILEDQVRGKFQDEKFEIQIIGFAKQVGDIADGAKNVLEFCAIALVLTALAVYWYCHSIRFTLLPIVCSLSSLIWQFGTLKLLGYGLDPLAVLVPFLVFSIGVSHGVQQINFIVRELAHGKTTYEASKSSFSGLLIPGSLALITAFVSFATLLFIPIPMVREMAVVAAIGVGYKILTNLVMLPLAASYLTFTKEYAAEAMLKREKRAGWLRILARVAEPKNAYMLLGVFAVVFAISVWQSKDRVIGTLEPGTPELRQDAQFNRDALSIAQSYDIGLDWLSVIFEVPPDSWKTVAIGAFVDDFSWKMRNVSGVISVDSYSNQLRTYNEGYNEGNPKMAVIPLDPINYGTLSTEIGRNRGYLNKDASMVAVHLFLADHKAVTINSVIREIKSFREANRLEGVTIRLAAGNAGILAAVNDEVEKSELPMILYVYLAIIILVFIAYRDFRAMVACCLPLTIGTFIGYWFMEEFQIGLTVATLPVMVLAVGVGVDYAFYIYNRLQFHLAGGQTIVKALEYSILEVGMATIFTAITLAVGVLTWTFSELKFQSDMGKLLAFMFVVNLIMAMTALPAFALVLEKLFPRRAPVRAPGMLNH